MSSAPADHLLELVICPECDAAVGASLPKCWLCGHPMDSPFKGKPPGALPAKMATSDLSREAVLNVSLGVAAVVLLVITAAVWAQEPALGFGLAFVIVPALVITLVSGLISRLQGNVMTPLARFAVFCKSFLAMLLVAVVTTAIAVVVAAVVIIAAIIAFLEACFKMAGGG